MVGWWGKGVLAEPRNPQQQALQTPLGDLLHSGLRWEENRCRHHCPRGYGSQREGRTWPFSRGHRPISRSRLAEGRLWCWGLGCILGAGGWTDHPGIVHHRLPLTCPNGPELVRANTVLCASSLSAARNILLQLCATSWLTASLGAIPGPLNPLQNLFSHFTRGHPWSGAESASAGFSEHSRALELHLITLHRETGRQTQAKETFTRWALGRRKMILQKSKILIKGKY